MIHRPADESGDILPVLSSSCLLRGSRAVAQLVRERLSLYTGDWWENPAWGNEILEMLEESRITEADGQVLSAYLSSYIREIPGVQDVREVKIEVEGRKFRYSCVIDTEKESVPIEYEV